MATPDWCAYTDADNEAMDDYDPVPERPRPAEYKDPDWQEAKFAAEQREAAKRLSKSE